MSRTNGNKQRTHTQTSNATEVDTCRVADNDALVNYMQAYVLLLLLLLAGIDERCVIVCSCGRWSSLVNAAYYLPEQHSR